VAFLNAELNHPFAPTPLGNDLYSNFLDEFATPIVGNFDPPLAFTNITVASDHTAPTSSVTALASTTNSSSFNVSWSGQDTGSGIASFNVYVSDNGGHYTPLVMGTTAASTTFNGVNGHTYSFMSVAIDKAGNMQTVPTVAQTITTVNVRTVTSTALAASLGILVPGQTIAFTATVSASGMTPTGSVTFKDGATVLGTAALQNGVATFTTAALGVGIHWITANYAGIGQVLASVGTIGAARGRSVYGRGHRAVRRRLGGQRHDHLLAGRRHGPRQGDDQERRDEECHRGARHLRPHGTHRGVRTGRRRRDPIHRGDDRRQGLRRLEAGHVLRRRRQRHAHRRLSQRHPCGRRRQ